MRNNERNSAAILTGLSGLLLGPGWAWAGVPEPLLADLQRVHQLDEAQLAEIRGIFDASSLIGQGVSPITHHPMTPAQCEDRLAVAGVTYRDAADEAICGGLYLAPLYDPATQRPDEATACIDKFEFPNVPCAYPVVWVRAKEAQNLCVAIGERLCDAHEWEGACAGALTAPDYPFDLVNGRSVAASVARMRSAHNRARVEHRTWAYGSAYEPGVCAAASAKSPGCDGSDSKQCGSNTYPAGAFPGCVSALGVYDQHGNAAEHMNLPLSPDQMSSRGSATLGVTEMKGSWFVFDHYRAHEDWCRWRAPFWHGGPVMDENSHRNYHLGFRCCKTLSE